MCYFVDIQLSNWPIYMNYLPLLAGGRNVGYNMSISDVSDKVPGKYIGHFIHV